MVVPGFDSQNQKSRNLEASLHATNDFPVRVRKGPLVPSQVMEIHIADEYFEDTYKA